MDDFESRLTRLKQATGLFEDQEIAAALGMSKAAFADRKKRDSFPEDKLFSLSAKRPDLGLDVDYILTGEEGGYTVVRAGQLRELLVELNWSDERLALELGLLGADAAAFCDQLSQARSGLRMRNAHIKRLVQEWRVRREFLVHGTQPMFGDADDEVVALNQRVRGLEDQLAALTSAVSSLAAALHDTGKSTTAYQDRLAAQPRPAPKKRAPAKKGAV